MRKNMRIFSNLRLGKPVPRGWPMLGLQTKNILFRGKEAAFQFTVQFGFVRFWFVPDFLLMRKHFS